MRARWLLPFLLASCAEEGGKAPPAPPAAASAPDFARWPADTTIAIRLPPPSSLAAEPDRVTALMKMLGHEGESPSAFLFGADATEGMDPNSAPWAAVTASGGWMRALLAADMASLRHAFAGVPSDVVAQETDGFLVLFRGTLPARGVEKPLPPGDLALRVHYHPLLASFTESGDVLEAAIDLGRAGFDARARLVPGPSSPTTDLLARAGACEGGLIDYLPPSAFLRIETGLPRVFAASGIARRLARHTGFAEEGDRVIVERLLREALTGADPATGLVIGIEAQKNEVSVVVVARDADGAPSPILRKLRSDERSTFGPLVLDHRDAPEGLVGWLVWIAQAKPELKDLPECLWTAVDRLSDESKGLPVSYAAFDGWSVVAFGPRADQLAAGTRARLENGSSRTAGASELRRLREDRQGDYLIGVVLEPGVAELPEADLAALRAAFGGSEGARGPAAFAAACFRGESGLEILARAYY